MSRRGDWFMGCPPRRQERPKRRPWESGHAAPPVDQGSLFGNNHSHFARICVEFTERTPPPPDGHWTWERECEAAENARIVGVSACRRRENPLWSTSEEWTEQLLDGSVRPIIADFEHPVGPGRYVVVASIWASTDYWGEHDEGIDVVDVRRSPGNCRRYWRRRAHERRSERRSSVPA